MLWWPATTTSAGSMCWLLSDCHFCVCCMTVDGHLDDEAGGAAAAAAAAAARDPSCKALVFSQFPDALGLASKALDVMQVRVETECEPPLHGWQQQQQRQQQQQQQQMTWHVQCRCLLLLLPLSGCVLLYGWTRAAPAAAASGFSGATGAVVAVDLIP